MKINAKFSNENGLHLYVDKLYEMSKQGHYFTGLMEAITNEVTIVTAIHNIKSNKGSTTIGVDLNKMDKYLKMPYDELIIFINQSISNYKPRPARRIYIPKANGKKRPLGIPTILDRIIQECIRIIIEPICEAKFYSNSYGFRPYRAQKHAIRDIVNIINASHRSKERPFYCIEGDIKGYFDNVNHRILMQKIWRIGIHDKRVLKIISLMIKAGYIEDNTHVRTSTGFGQGSIISPLLSNIYLNDFDWYIGRMYFHPKAIEIKESSQRKKLLYHGVIPKYLIRYCDDWVILTTSLKEAKRLKEDLTKYFKHSLKLELSEEKTKITDIRNEGIKFLGFKIEVEKSKILGKTGNDLLIAKPYPDLERVINKTRNICLEIHKLKQMNYPQLRIEQIEKINSMILGLAEYIRIGICTKAFNMMDYRINETSFEVWKRIFGDDYLKYKVPLKELSNIPQRHKDYETKTFAILHEGKYVGITYAFLTHVKYENKPFCQKMTPYSKEGRSLYKVYSKRFKTPRDRPCLYKPTELFYALYSNDKYNFEYYMNREYAYNRDKGKCRCCGDELVESFRECHHIYPKFKINEINKITNLAWVCTNCHKYIHGKELSNEIEKKIQNKVVKFRNKLNEIN